MLSLNGRKIDVMLRAKRSNGQVDARLRACFLTHGKQGDQFQVAAIFTSKTK